MMMMTKQAVSLASNLAVSNSAPPPPPLYFFAWTSFHSKMPKHSKIEKPPVYIL